ncbi:MAG: VIT and vWA domain-containing protein [Nannocystales bacterium]
MTARRLGWGLLLLLLLTACTSGRSRTVEPEEIDGSRAWKGGRATPGGLWSHTDPGDLPTVVDGTGTALPLVHTDVDAVLTGHVADVTVSQTFRNEATDVIEVVFAFPLPENAAVSRMRLVVGGRVIESRIQDREQARMTYEEAKEQGHAAALLEQERPNVFTQSLANIPPGEDIDVEIDYVQTLSYDAGTYEFVFPMVIGPRYDHGTTADAGRVSPAIAGAGLRRGDDIELRIRAKTGHPIERWWTPTHEVVGEVVAGELHVELARADERPNRDFVLRYAVAGPDPRATMFLGPQDVLGRGRFALVVHPPDLDVDALVGRREFVFVIDRSGSMGGEPLALSKETVRRALTHMRPVDTFDVVTFESGIARLFGRPRPANAANLAKALRFLDGLESGGGTEMGDAIELALHDDVERGRHRYVFLLTDGFISFEDEVIRTTRTLVKTRVERGQHARVFGIGVGDSPNGHLINGVSKAGLGAGLRLATQEDLHHVVQTFTRWVDHPIVDDLRLHSGDLQLSQYHPKDLGGLFASHAAIVHGQYHGDVGSSRLVLEGNAGPAPVEIPVRVVDASHRGNALDTLWARAAVADLEFDWWTSHDDATKAAITRIGLRHHIVTAFTSLVAVDGSRVIGDGRPRLVAEGSEVLVVSASATASRSSAGLSLAGTTAAESEYVVEGANINDPSFGTVGSVPQEFVQPSNSRNWQPRARVTFGRPKTPTGIRVGDIRKPAQAVRRALRACYERSSDFSRNTRYVFPIELEWTADGVEVRTTAGALKNVKACFKSVLLRADWPDLPAGTKITFPLRLSAQ